MKISMKKSLFLILVLFSFIQTNAQESSNLLHLEEASPEKIYVHVNTSMPFVGEYLYFKINCLEAGSNKYSNISKIAYLDLIDKDFKVVYNQVIDLKDGKGYGDFFIPTDIGSGNYKLIAYTKWMKNNPDFKFFEQDIFIINPYTSAQANIRKDSIKYAKTVVKTEPILKLAKGIFKNRERVNMDISGIPKGEYSISVRKIDSLPHPTVISSTNFYSNTKNANYNVNAYPLPELRGKLLSGKISSDKFPVYHKKLALSVPGEDYFLRQANTDKNGVFYFNIDENFVGQDALIQVLEEENNYEIQLDENSLPDISGLEFSDYGIDSRAEDWIKERSVYNQIENAYFNLKPDTVHINQSSNIFKGLNQIVYDLDNYTRFETVQETFVEIVPFARVRIRNEKFEFAVLGKPPFENFDGKPLVVVDGLILQDTDNFIRYFKSARIAKIKIVQEPYYLSSAIYKGIIIIETIDSNFAENYSRDYLKSVRLTTGNIRKNYFRQAYDDPKNSSKLPDFRTQILWMPELDQTSSKNISFYTSDVDGNFEISLQGFTNEGKPVSLQKTFTVN